MWDKKILYKHLQAAKLLEKIKDQSFKLIGSTPGISEFEVQQFVYKQYKFYGLKTDRNPPIVGFNENSAIPHYFPEKKTALRLKNNTFVLLDLWARLNEKHSPFADITWVGYHGRKIPPQIQKIFTLTLLSSDQAIRYIKGYLNQGLLPVGWEIDAYAKSFVIEAGYEKNILHSTGHALGYASPHGRLGRNLNTKNKYPLIADMGYTIEPGIYFPGKFGIRSEIDFYIDKNLKFHLTTTLQKRIVAI